MTPAKAVKGKAPSTREEWLGRAAGALRATLFEQAGIDVPPVRVSIGWPGGRGKKGNVIGQCWAPFTVKDATPAIFISPVLSEEEPVVILATLVHEMVHAAGHMQHRSSFAKAAAAVGLVKPWTATSAGEELKPVLTELAERLGPFGHAQITPGGVGGLKPPVQSTRMLKVSCPTDGYTLRATAKWLKIAVPSCPICDAVMVVEAPKGAGEEPE